MLEVAKEFPEARVTGIDLAYPVFEIDELSPENATFVVGDVTERIDVPDGTVDLVHSR